MPDPAARRVRFEKLSAQECRELMGTTTVGRTGFTSSSGQVILPVNFAFRDGSVFFRTAATGPVAELTGGVDDGAFEVDDQVHIPGAGTSLPQPWAAGERDVLLQLSPRTMSGRRVSRPG